MNSIIGDLSPEQPLRRIQNPPAYEKIEGILNRLRDVVPEPEDEGGGREALKNDPDRPLPPITVKLEDPSGHSFVEFIGSMADPKWNMQEYKRSREENTLLGLISADDVQGGKTSLEASLQPGERPDMDEVFVFPGVCSSCSRPLDTKMKRVNIPHFKEIVIMSTNCEACGYRDNEVKSSGAVSDQGKRITIKVVDQDDLSRDILKVCPSPLASVSVC